MADSPLESLYEQIDVISDSKKYRCRNTIHLTFTQESTTNSIPSFIFSIEEDVPEYLCDEEWFTLNGYRDTIVKLDSHQLLAESAVKSAYLIQATRWNSDESAMQSFSAIFTFLNVEGDWRCVNRNPISITKA
jgi:hypothetical protein